MSSVAAGPSLAEGYTHRAGTFDELTGGGEVRGHWRTLLDELAALGPTEIARRWEHAQELIHDNGVSYDVHGEGQGTERPWRLSPVPVVLSPDEWQALVPALAQRARLLELVLEDLYGPQHLVHERLLPPELLFGHPGYLRACHGTIPGDGRWLPFYAVDLVRGPDGRFLVLSDRTQVPTGAGYALENRIIVSRALPEAFRACQVQRLAPFFQTVRDTLARLAPRNKDNPRIVLLSPGATDPTYFEQAYLAHYLGYPVVHGGDLTVRSGRVYLKTLGGLHQVDVIVRRVEDALCDPLELRPDALGGVPGLVQAVRERAVAIANPLGSGLASTPALLPYLPAIARRMLGEELRLASVPTMWCGDADARAVALDRLPALVWKPAFDVTRVHPIFASTLDEEGRQRLRARAEREGAGLVAQEAVALGSTPALIDGRLAPRPWVLRVYLVATADGHAVMPGGLARFTRSADGFEVSIHRGGFSKDTWVRSRGPVAPFSLLPPSTAPITLSRGGGELPSRVADNLFWLGRYAARAEDMARLARIVVPRLAEQTAERAPAAELWPLCRAMLATAHMSDGALPPSSSPDALTAYEAAAQAALEAAEQAGSLRGTLRSLQRVARECRDRLSTDSWRVVMSIETDGPLAPTLDALVVTLSALGGIISDSMSRGQAWRFLDMGRRLERASGLVKLLARTLPVPCERSGALLEAVLEAADSGMTYRRRYLNRLEVAPVLDLLLTDETNPRSVMFQATALAEHVAALPRDGDSAVRRPEQRLVLEVLHALELADVEAMATVDPGGETRAALAALLERLGAALPAVSDSLAASYLSHASVSRQLGSRGDAR